MYEYLVAWLPQKLKSKLHFFLIPIPLVYRCNTFAGVKLIGIQIDPDNEKCQSPDLLLNNFHEFDLQRTLVTTFGSYASIGKKTCLK